MDPMAVNYDANAKKDGPCTYSSVTFYASSNTFTGVEVTKIEVTIMNDTIGVITNFNQPYPESCNEAGTIKYDFIGTVPQVWFARYYLASGGSVTRQEEIMPNPNEACIRVDILP